MTYLKKEDDLKRFYKDVPFEQYHWITELLLEVELLHYSDLEKKIIKLMEKKVERENGKNKRHA